MTDSHTYNVGGVNLVMAVILVTSGELLKFTHDVICRAGVSVPVCIYVVGVVGHSGGRLLVRRAGEVGVETLEATQYGMAFLAVELAS